MIALAQVKVATRASAPNSRGQDQTDKHVLCNTEQANQPAIGATFGRVTGDDKHTARVVGERWLAMHSLMVDTAAHMGVEPTTADEPQEYVKKGRKGR